MAWFLFKRASTKPAPPPSHPLIERMRWIARWMDTAVTIPIINRKIGLDPILGLLPGGGDAIGVVISCYAFWVAYQLNMPARVYWLLGINILLDSTVGAIPVVGDVVDCFWKANVRNVRVLEQAYQTHGDRSHLSMGPVLEVQAE